MSYKGKIMNNKILSHTLNLVISIACVILWIIGGLFLFFYLNILLPLTTELLLPLYFLLWIAFLPIGNKIIEKGLRIVKNI
jgi:hypothetical protein